MFECYVPDATVLGIATPGVFREFGEVLAAHAGGSRRTELQGTW